MTSIEVGTVDFVDNTEHGYPVTLTAEHDGAFINLIFHGKDMFAFCEMGDTLAARLYNALGELLDTWGDDE